MKTHIVDTLNHASIIEPDEMRDARLHLEAMLAGGNGRQDSGAVQTEITCVSQGWGKLQDRHVRGRNPALPGGADVRDRFGTHAESEIIVRLPVGARRLTGLCGVNDSPDTRQFAKPLVFSVEVDGREIWRSGPQDAAAAPARVDARLAGCRQFTLKVKGPIALAHADWVNLKATLANGKIAEICEPQAIGSGFSFTFDGQPSTALLPAWRLKKQRRPERDGVILHRIIRTDPKTGLAVICEIREYTRFPVVEWGLRFKNTATSKTHLIENIRSLDLTTRLGQFPYLNYWTGDYCKPDGYEPFRVSLAHGEEYRFAPMGGRPTNRAWPYYDLESQDAGRGLKIVVGWPGQWSACFHGDDNHAVHIAAGQELTHFKLLPGEEARTPLSVLMFYRGDRTRSRNLWRRWYFNHVMPRPGGRPMQPHLACAATDEGEEFTAATEENQIRYIGKFNRHGIHPDVWWIDAGWYPCYNQDHQRRWWLTGTWKPDPERFPRGLKPVSDHAAHKGADLMLWYEPERVTPASALDREHPEWLVKNEKNDRHDNSLLNLGNPKCSQWLTDNV